MPEIDEDFYEGSSFLSSHLSRERNRRLVMAAKKKRIAEDGDLSCDVCGFSFKKHYGEIGQGFIEVHHVIPMSRLNKKTKVLVDDLALLCSNCHRMIHRGDPLLTIKELKELISAA